MSNNTISSQLKLYRTLNHYSQQQIADYLGIAPSAYNHYESGARTPGVDKLAMLAKLYNLEDQILGVYKNDANTFNSLKSYTIADITNSLPDDIKPQYSLQSNNVNKKIYIYESQYNALVRYFSNITDNAANLSQKKKLLSEIYNSKSGNDGKIYEVLVYEWLIEQGISYSIQPSIKSSECLKQNDYDADGVIEDCIFDVKTFGITLPNINRLQEKLNKLCPKEYSAYYITISGNLDIANDILTKLLSKVPELITKVFNEQNKTCTDFIYKLPEYQLELRAHNTSKTNIISSISEFNPYKWAMENQFYFFHHASQFCVDKPYIIICPYDNKTAKQLASGSPESLSTSLRALCRRMFMGMPEDKYISTYDDKSIPMVTLAEAAKCISAIIFQDISMNSSNDDTWLYINPNAKNKLPGYIINHFRLHNCSMYEDYLYDIY